MEHPPKWSMSEARPKLEQLIHDAVTNGPQIITMYGKNVSVVMSIEEYKKRFPPPVIPA